MDDPRLARWLDDDDFDPDKILAELTEQQGRVEAVRSVIAETTISVRSPDRLVTVTMNGASAVTAIDLHPDALRDLDAAQLGASILRTLHEGMAEAGEIVRQQLGTVFDDELVSDAMQSWPGARMPEEEDDDAERPAPYFGRHYAV